MLTKTDYLIYFECRKNAWVKIHKPYVYFAHPPSQFDLALLETGNEVDVLARDLFPWRRSCRIAQWLGID